MQSGKITVVAVVGPTASGKSALAAWLAAELGGEVISADSMQIYKGMDIATAKTTKEEMLGVPHHLMDFAEPSRRFSVAEYTALAHEKIAEITKRGKLPVMCGGTGLYIDSVLQNISFGGEGEDEEKKAAIREKYKEKSGAELLEILRETDPEYAASLHPNNRGRILRGIEIYELSGITQTEAVRLSRAVPSPYNAVYIGLTCRDRQKLYDRINRRVDDMMSRGLEAEARQYAALRDDTTAVQAIGYKELFPYIGGEKTLAECTENLKQATRRYAKRQLTWFNKNENIHWFYTDDYDNFESLKEEVLSWLTQETEIPANRKKKELP